MSECGRVNDSIVSWDWEVWDYVVSWLRRFGDVMHSLELIGLRHRFGPRERWRLRCSLILLISSTPLQFAVESRSHHVGDLEIFDGLVQHALLCKSLLSISPCGSERSMEIVKGIFPERNMKTFKGAINVCAVFHLALSWLVTQSGPFSRTASASLSSFSRYKAE